MNSESLPLKSSSGGGQSAFAIADEIPLTVRQAAVFLGVSPQTVYLWVERKQIPHLRVMGRNIRFLKSELGALPRNFQSRGGLWQDLVNMMVPYSNATTERFFGLPTEIGNGKRIRESTFTEDWQEAQRKLRERLQARDDKLLEIVRKGEQLQFSDVGGFFPGKLFPAAHPRRENTRGQFARRSAFKESLRGSQARGSLSGRHRVVSASGGSRIESG